MLDSATIERLFYAYLKYKMYLMPAILGKTVLLQNEVNKKAVSIVIQNFTIYKSALNGILPWEGYYGSEET